MLLIWEIYFNEGGKTYLNIKFSTNGSLNLVIIYWENIRVESV